MSVDDFGLVAAECAADGTEREQVLPGADAASEFREDAEIEPAFSGALFEGAFWTSAGTGDQADFVFEDVMLVIDIEERVFLGTAEDEPRDDVGGTHSCQR
ncbi:MAG: hypothetical protein RL215_2001 [Planctomycetota bacterium]